MAIYRRREPGAGPRLVELHLGILAQQPARTAGGRVTGLLPVVLAAKGRPSP
ncbi:hypothetical protein [Deinococcus sp.]|uniref:hypothetical protein n=1 Tax=Deinococcus sp. TaxID=47478 RepID=UPI003CC558AA